MRNSITYVETGNAVLRCSTMSCNEAYEIHVQEAAQTDIPDIGYHKYSLYALSTYSESAAFGGPFGGGGSPALGLGVDDVDSSSLLFCSPSAK